MPSSTPSAPSASAAARPAPSTNPPAASTGSGETALTTWRTITVLAISPMCPPPSLPCATMTSAPASAARTASSTTGTMCITLQPRSCALAKIAARSWSSRAQAVEKISGSSASVSSTRSSIACSSRLMPSGLEVSSRARRTMSATSSGCRNDAPRTPSPPASDTAPTSSPLVAPPPIPADATGCSMPTVSVKRVRSTRQSLTRSHPFDQEA